MNVCLNLNVLFTASFFCNCARVVVIVRGTVVVVVGGGDTVVVVVGGGDPVVVVVGGGCTGLLVVVFVGLLNTMPCSSCISSEFRSCQYQQACSRSVIRVFPR